MPIKFKKEPPEVNEAIKIGLSKMSASKHSARLNFGAQFSKVLRLLPPNEQSLFTASGCQNCQKVKTLEWPSKTLGGN